jgi:hypothetical protein
VGADPLASPMVGFGLLFEPFKKVFDQLFRCHFGKLVFINAESSGQFFRRLEPLLQKSLSYLIEFLFGRVNEFGAFEMVGKDLVIQIKVALAAV